MRLAREPAARHRFFVLLAVAASALVVGLAIGAGSDDGSSEDAAPPATTPQQRAERTVRQLPLRVALGQTLVSSFDGTRVPDYIERRLRARQIAGVILFGQNATTRAGFRSIGRAVQRASGRGALVAVDQEGGDIRILPFAPPAASQPLQGPPAAVRRQARAAGRALRGAGINVNLAPVADVAVGPTAAMAGRTFPGDAEAVGARVRASVRGLRDAGVAATAKHFPGLGGAVTNTDDGSATVDLLDGELERRDLPPFRAAIAERVPLIMLSHALYPATDRRRIASQSRAITTDLLRDELGFEGVAVTDSIEAQAVLDRSGVATAAERSLAAGADLILMTGSGSWNEVYPRLLARARRDPAFRARVREAAARVLALERSLGLRAPAG